MDDRQTTGTGGHRHRLLQPRSHQTSPLYLSQMHEHLAGQDLLHQHRIPEARDYGALDDYGGPFQDRALLAEPHRDRQWQAVQGLSRLSLPPRSLATSSNPNHSMVFPDAVHYGHDSDHDISRTFSRLPHPTEIPSSSPSSALTLGRQFDATRDFGDQSVLPRSQFIPSPVYNSSSPSYKVNQRRTFPNRRKKQIEAARQAPGTSRAPPVLELQHANSQANRRAPGSEPPVIQGIPLVSPNELPDRFRSVFPFPIFNAVQSKCFKCIYGSNYNLVLSAPTGSGKTIVLELAICRLVSQFQAGQFKIVYMAPTKSLCAERQADWHTKFNHLDLQCAELTGDTEQAQLRNVQSASIIITTPEKWDSMTRKWKDHIKLVQLVKLFLIDEVHILKESRGATLEAVVSRMKSVGSDIRFVALSATVPNFDDVATWLGKSQSNQNLPALREKFGEEFRPVQLQKFVYGLPFRGNDFAFDSVCDSKLPEIIQQHSEGKPIMVFCCTRKSTMTTAKALAALWTKKGPHKRHWPTPSKTATVSDQELQITLASGVAFHHAGLDLYDRQAIEKGYLDRDVSVICCTSTLAVGVNLPCHLVIIKNTVSWQDEGLKEYADLEMMQMLGRAGRPQFGNTAAAVIITKQEKVGKYEKLVSGTEVLESCLHSNLIDHLNAEIGLGTVHDLHTAKRWLAGTFLYVRLRQNPAHYKLDSNAADRSLDERIEQICDRDIKLLQDTKLVSKESSLKSTEFGNAMARYYVKFETMEVLLTLPPRAKMSEILSVLAQAVEFHDIRFRSGEKNLYKTLNAASGIKFPIQVDIAFAAQKRSIIMQAELGGVEFPTDEQYAKHRNQYQQDRLLVFTHVHRLIRCIIDCQIHLRDGPATRHALELARSFGARVWDNSPLQMKQVPLVGPVTVRKLVTAGINSLETLEATEAYRINMLLSKQPGFGEKILGLLQTFPKLRVSVKLMGKDVKPEQRPKVKIKAEVGFINEKIPTTFNKKSVYVCFLAERSDGFLIDFRRLSAKQLGNGEDIFLSTELHSEGQNITCYVMCDDLAGTLRYAEIKPELPRSAFPALIETATGRTRPSGSRPVMNISRRRSRSDINSDIELSCERDDEGFPDDDIADTDMIAAANEVGYKNIDTFQSPTENESLTPALKSHATSRDRLWKPQQLETGKWACNHKCKDKTACKHLCCREGVDKAPKAPKQSTGKDTSIAMEKTASKKPASTVSTVPPRQTTSKLHQSTIEVLDLSIEHGDEKNSRPSEMRALSSYMFQGNPTKRAPVLRSIPSKPKFISAKDLHVQLSTLKQAGAVKRSFDDEPSEFEASWIDNLPSPSALLRNEEDVPLELQEEPIVEEHSDIGDKTWDRDSERLGFEEPLSGSDSVHNVLTDAGQSADGGELGQKHFSVDLGGAQDQLLDDYSLPILDRSFGILQRTQTQPSQDRLFLSTDSPEKALTAPEGVDKDSEPQVEEHSNEPAKKRQCLSEQKPMKPLMASLGAENRAQSLEDLRKRLPWDGIRGDDLEFLLDLDIADIVEFV
ncbi:Sec63 [Lambiella insularis]|nr:Sec63 [Lambiella insularis]